MAESTGDQPTRRPEARRLARFSVFGTMTGVLLLAVIVRGDEPGDASAKRPKRRAVPFTISKETTHITKPLRPDGYVDYAKALNQVMSKGVTPKNNAAVLVFRAIGPQIDDVPIAKRFFKELGMEPLPEKGDYFVDLYEFFRALDPTPKEDDEEKFYDARDAATARPWTEKEHPLIARWLTKNAVPMRLAVEASRRTHYYAPIVGEHDDDPLLIMDLLSGIAACRSLSRALQARAMLHAGHGRIDAAWDDIMACHRLARLYAKGPTFVNQLVGIAFDTIPIEGGVALVQHGKLTSQQIKRFANDLRQLAPIGGLAERLDVGERYYGLDTVCMIARDGAGRLGSEFDVGIFQTPFELKAIRYLPRPLLDWDHILATIQRRYDDMVAAVREPSRAKRLAALKLLDDQSKQLISDARDPKSIIQRLLTRSPRRFVSESVANAYVMWMFWEVSLYLHTEDRGRTRLTLARVSFALAAFHADKQTYPKKLSALSPKYLAKVPRDVFADGDFHYQVTKDGYLLYSVGPNGRDDHGRGMHMENFDGDGDDIVVGTLGRKSQGK